MLYGKRSECRCCTENGGNEAHGHIRHCFLSPKKVRSWVMSRSIAGTGEEAASARPLIAVAAYLARVDRNHPPPVV